MDEKRQPQRPNRPKAANPSGTATSAPNTVSPERKAELLNQARVARDFLVPAALSTMVGTDILDGMAARIYLNTVFRDAGDPTDPVERMLLEQLTFAHHRLLQLSGRADLAPSPEHLKILNGAANRLLGEFRRLALALKAYRQPGSNRSFSVVHQQNVVAAGSQQVSYVDQSSSAEDKVALKVKDRGELEGNPAEQAVDGHPEDEKPETRGRWEAQRAQAATVE